MNLPLLLPSQIQQKTDSNKIQIWFRLADESGRPFLGTGATKLRFQEVPDLDDFCDEVKKECANELSLVDVNMLKVYASEASFEADENPLEDLETGTGQLGSSLKEALWVVSYCAQIVRFQIDHNCAS